MKNVLITGTSSGLGKSLAQQFLKNDYNVYGISRSPTNVELMKSEMCDFSELNTIEARLEKLINGVDCFDYVFLNAGILGDLKPVSKITLDEYKNIFNINVWSNKVLLDYVFSKHCANNIIAISSGAAMKTYFGWSLYCCSKAALKQLISSYEDEYKAVNFVSLAPGLVKSKMQDKIYGYDESEIPSVRKFKDAYDNMQTPDECAKKILHNLDEIYTKKENGFFDLRGLQ
jgi:alcohol dehydrogenase/benzil reductase ((S)-benzoin forming)